MSANEHDVYRGMNYAFDHAGRTFTPDGPLDCPDTEAHNRETEQRELAWLQTGPARLFLYVRLPEHSKQTGTPCGQGGATELPRACLTTWPGTVVSSACRLGRSVPVGGIAGPWARKRSVEAVIFGRRYVGWYWESAGDYCRLRLAKRQQ